VVLFCLLLRTSLISKVASHTTLLTCYNHPMEISPKWKSHPLAQKGLVELVPTDWVYQFRGPDVTPEASLMDGSAADMETLWQNINEEGMSDPLIIRVGAKNRKFRLESGNHRIQIFKKYGIEHTPIVVQVQDECGPQADDVMNTGTHNFDFADDVIETNLKPGYLKPSEVFKSLAEKIGGGLT